MNRKKERKYLFLIIVIFIAACIETDIIFLHFPEMMVWFLLLKVLFKSLLTWNFFGYLPFRSIFMARISDAFGRKNL